MYCLKNRFYLKIGKMYKHDGETDTFEIQAGVLQGDTLAPFLFITVTKKKQRAHLCSGIQNMDYQGHATKPMCRFSLKILD